MITTDAMDSPREVERMEIVILDDTGTLYYPAHMYQAAQAEVAALKERLEAAHAALRHYGRHNGLCDSKWAESDFVRPCDCGLNAALARGGQG